MRLRPTANVQPPAPPPAARAARCRRRARRAPRRRPAPARAPPRRPPPDRRPRARRARRRARLTAARAPRSATARTRARQPSSVGRLRVGASDDHRAPVLQVRGRAPGRAPAISSRPPASRVQSACRNSAAAPSEAMLRSAHALHLGGDQRHQQPAHQRRGLGAGAHVQRADHRVGDPQRDRADPVPARQQRTLVGRRARGDRERPARARRSRRRSRRARARRRARPRAGRRPTRPPR